MIRRRPIPRSRFHYLHLRWNGMNSTERYELLRRWYPDCWAVNSMCLKTWMQLPPAMRRILRTNP
jgi:hypothetical protein